MIDHVTDPETGDVIDLTGLIPQERAFALMLIFRPKEYDGAFYTNCLVGPPALEIDKKRVQAWARGNVIEPESPDDAPWAVLARASGDETLGMVLRDIFCESAEPQYRSNWSQAIKYAARVLAVNYRSVAKFLGKEDLFGTTGKPSSRP